MIHLFTGSFRALEEALVSDLHKVRGGDALAPVLIVSPSGHMLTRLQQVLTASAKGLLNVHCLSFYGLADRLLSQDPPKDKLVADPTLYAEVIRGLLEGDSDAELVLRDYFRRPDRPLPKGLPSALAGTLRDLRDSGARVVDSLKAALEGHLGEAAPEAAPTLELYARLYEVLQHRGLRSNADQLRRAAQRIPSDPFIAQQKSVYLYGFYDLTGVQLDFALSFASHPRTHIYFPYRDGHPSYRYAERLLLDPALTSKIDRRVTLPEPPSGPPKGEVWNCSGTPDEVWLAAKKVMELADAGVPYDRIAIVARTLGPFVTLLRETLEAHQIPYQTAQEEPVGAFPLIKAARQLLVLDRDDFALGSVFDVLKSPYFTRGAASPGLGDMRRAERMARYAGVTSSWTTWESRLTHWSSRDVPEDVLEELSPGLSAAEARGVAGDLLALLKQLRESLRVDDTVRTWSDHVAWARSALERWLTLPPDASADELALWRALLSELDALSTLDALGRPVSATRFLETWEEKMDALSVALAPQNNSGVHILDVMSARGLQFDAVLLLGLNEKSFPRLIREDPFLSDAARSALAQALGCRLGRKLDGYDEERLLFQLAQEMSAGPLIVCYQRSDEEGKALVPSLYLHELPEASYPRHHLARTPGEKWLAFQQRLTPKEMSVWLSREGVDPIPFYQAAGADPALFVALARAQTEIESFRQPLGVRDGVVGDHPLLKPLVERGFSPDGLRDLAECPFRYFAAKVLNLEAVDDIQKRGEVAADAAGKLIHRILEVFFRQLAKRRGVLSLDQMHQVLNEVADDCFRRFQETAAGLYPVAWQATQDIIRERLHGFLQADLQELAETGFKPMYFEEDIEGHLPLNEPDLRKQNFRGRIDRIDLREVEGSVEYRVVDYKTGRPSRRGTKAETAILRGSYLQLPVYLGIAGPWLEKKTGKPAKPHEAAFYNLADWERGEASPAIGPDFWQQCGKVFGENLAGMIALVRQGVFYIRPSEDMAYCDWCEFSQVCRKEHKPSAARSENNPVRQANDSRLARKADDA